MTAEEEREELMDRLQDIQEKNYSRFKGVNEGDLHTREDIADLFDAELKEAREDRRKLLIDFLEYFDGGIVEDVPKSKQVKNYYYPINEIDDFLNKQDKED